jgi:hypothetical protein
MIIHRSQVAPGDRGDLPDTDGVISLLSKEFFRLIEQPLSCQIIAVCFWHEAFFSLSFKRLYQTNV